METELEEVELRLRNSKGMPPADLLVKYLRLVRELSIRDSASVARYGNMLLRNHKGVLAEDELWTVHEQVAVAALDCGALPFAASLIKAVNRRFPDSIRAFRLHGMYYEASGDFDTAEQKYKELLTVDPTSDMALKRLVALERSRGRVHEAIEKLKQYLDVYSNDSEAWEDLAELYLEVLNYWQAAFCYEELITINPTNSNYYVRYADILYTLGGTSNYKAAKAYYAKAIDLTAGGSLRALYGICACCANITEKVALQDTRSRAQIELPGVSVQALLRTYQEKAPSMLPMVQALLTKQGLVSAAS